MWGKAFTEIRFWFGGSSARAQGKLLLNMARLGFAFERKGVVCRLHYKTKDIILGATDMCKEQIKFQRRLDHHMPWWLVLILISLVLWGIACLALVFI